MKEIFFLCEVMMLYRHILQNLFSYNCDPYLLITVCMIASYYCTELVAGLTLPGHLYADTNNLRSINEHARSE